MLHVEVRDDGVGGADPDGHGLVGMRDRVTALGGRLEIESPAGGGTLVAATLPLSGRRARTAASTDAPASRFIQSLNAIGVIDTRARSSGAAASNKATDRGLVDSSDTWRFTASVGRGRRQIDAA